MSATEDRELNSRPAQDDEAGAWFAMRPREGHMASKELPYELRASLLERIVGEAHGRGSGLRQLQVIWRIDAKRRIDASLTGVASWEARKGDRCFSYAASVSSALADISLVEWSEPSPSRTRLPVGARPQHRALLRIKTSGTTDESVELYPLMASTIRRALLTATSPTTIRISFLILPRRPEIRPAEPASGSPFGRFLAVGAPTASERSGPARVDAAERWSFLVRVEVESTRPIPESVLAAIASDIRGAGTTSIAVLLSGRAAAVDVEWERVEPSAGRPQPDAWPPTAVRLNLREAACLLALPPAGPDEYKATAGQLVPEAVPRRGLTIGTSGDGRRPVAVPEADLLRHVYVCGQTGTGKTTNLVNMVAQWIRDPSHPTIVVVDPHDSLISQIASLIPDERLDHVLYFRPVDLEAPVPFNPMEATTFIEKARAVDALLSLFWEMFDPRRTMMAGMGPQAEDALRCTIRTVMSKPGGTIGDVYDLLIDDDNLSKYAAHIKEPELLAYWHKRSFMNSKDKSEVISYFVSKVSELATNPIVRAIVEHPTSTLDFKQALAEGWIILLDLDKGGIGQQTSLFFSRLILAALWRAAMLRGPVGAGDRVCHLVLDECQNFAGEAVTAMLAEGRKFGVSLTLANQHTSQLPESMFEAIAGNVGNVVSYRLGVRDAPLVATILGEGEELARRLTRLPNYRAMARILVNGEPQPPFLIKSPAPLPAIPGRIELVRERSRSRFGYSSQKAAGKKAEGQSAARTRGRGRRSAPVGPGAELIEQYLDRFGWPQHERRPTADGATELVTTGWENLDARRFTLWIGVLKDQELVQFVVPRVAQAPMSARARKSPDVLLLLGQLNFLSSRTKWGWDPTDGEIRLELAESIAGKFTYARFEAALKLLIAEAQVKSAIIRRVLAGEITAREAMPANSDQFVE